jgi:copper chaperone CopZ
MAEITTNLAVPDVHCDHCKAGLERAVGALDGVSEVAVDLPGKVVSVTHDPARAPVGRIVAVVEEQGYEVAGSGEAA